MSGSFQLISYKVMDGTEKAHRSSSYFFRKCALWRISHELFASTCQNRKKRAGRICTHSVDIYDHLRVHRHMHSEGSPPHVQEIKIFLEAAEEASDKQPYHFYVAACIKAIRFRLSWQMLPGPSMFEMFSLSLRNAFGGNATCFCLQRLFA